MSLVLCAIAGLSTALALAFQDRALSRDLSEAAHGRLDRAAAAADRLVDNHLATLIERYRSISATPELRANLEVGDEPTLRYYAERLLEQQSAAALLFVDQNDSLIATAGSDRVITAAKPKLRLREGATLLDLGGDVFAMVAVPLRSSGRLLGALVGVERVSGRTLALWSELCGARLRLRASDSPLESAMTRLVRDLGGTKLHAEVSLETERDALWNARRNLLTGGALTLACAFAMSLFLSRGLVRPIREIQNATEPIGRGDLGVRLSTDRRDEIGDVARAFNVMVERLEEALAELRQSQARLASAQHLARLGSWTSDLDGSRIRGSDEFLHIYAFSPDEEPLSANRLLRRIHPEDRERFRQALRACAKEGQPFQLDHRTIELEGEQRFLHSQCNRVESIDGSVYLEGTVQDFTDRKLVEEQVRYLAHHDSLTGLGNRLLFQEHLGLAIREAQREGLLVGVIFLDLDNFKMINDTMGHSVGDELLQQVATRLVACVRPVGVRWRVAGDEFPGTVCRLGGDEFAVLLTDVRSPEDAARAARSVLRSLSRPFAIETREVPISASVGIGMWPADGYDSETLIRNCDTALYHAKEEGRGDYQFYSESMNAVVFKRMVLENGLRRAIERDELELEFQPKVEIATGAVKGIEALTRWRDSELGVVSPSEFIPLAEETGLIDAIGDWAMAASLDQLKEWQEGGLGKLRVSVNVSAQQLYGHDLVEDLSRMLDERALDPKCLDVEITETALMRDEGAAVAALEQLRERGITISLDDFGTGYSSLSYLRRLPIDTVKIDRSFLRRVDTEPADAALLGAIISMAKVLHLRVVVEGVETEEQLEFLREVGCDEIQGNFLSPPVLGQDVPRLIAELRRAHRKRRRSTRAPTRARRRPKS